MSSLAVQPIVQAVAKTYGLDANAMIQTLKGTIFPSGAEATNQQMVAFLSVASEYKLNPFLKEIYAFPAQGGGIVPIVSIDGWLSLMNRDKHMDGLEIETIVHPSDESEGVRVTVHRKDRAHPTVITEWMKEVRRNTGPWKSHPSRMLRHKGIIQAARVAFGYGGIYDEDEAEGIIEHVDVESRPIEPTLDLGSLAPSEADPEDDEAANLHAKDEAPPTEEDLREADRKLFDEAEG